MASTPAPVATMAPTAGAVSVPPAGARSVPVVAQRPGHSGALILTATTPAPVPVPIRGQPEPLPALDVDASKTRPRRRRGGARRLKGGADVEAEEHSTPEANGARNGCDAGARGPQETASGEDIAEDPDPAQRGNTAGLEGKPARSMGRMGMRSVARPETEPFAEAAPVAATRSMGRMGARQGVVGTSGRKEASWSWYEASFGDERGSAEAEIAVSPSTSLRRRSRNASQAKEARDASDAFWEAEGWADSWADGWDEWGAADSWAAADWGEASGWEEAASSRSGANARYRGWHWAEATPSRAAGRGLASGRPARARHQLGRRG